MSIWTEKFRPKIREDVVGNKEVIDSIFDMVKTGNITHMIFEGSAGIGKTTVALLVAHILFGENFYSNFIEFNASDERGINIVREQIKTFVRTVPMGATFKIILLDESDEMCLPEDTEIIIGRKNTQRGYRTTKIQNFYSSRLCPMPSVNLETGKIEEDKGKLIDSGYADFYKLTLKDGRIVEASDKHPFFKLENNKLQKILLKDLKVGDCIVDYQENIMNKCKVCGKFTLHNFCDKTCRDIYHTYWMKKTGGFMFGKTHTEEVRKRISLMASRPFEEKYGIERVYIERAKRSKYGINGFKDSNYRRLLGKNKFTICVKCGASLKTNGNDGIYVHHIDGNRENNKPENLLFVCPKCHNLKCHNILETLLKKRCKVSKNKTEEIDPIEIMDIKYIGKKKAYNITMKKNASFLLGNGILTHNTADAQHALRRLMEKYSDVTKFIFCVNSVEKLIDPIRSRCQEFHFAPLSPADIEKRLFTVYGIEVPIVDAQVGPAISKIAEFAHGDMRRALNHLQTLLASGRDLTVELVEQLRPFDAGKVIYESISAGRFLEARQHLQSAIELGYTERYIIDSLHNIYKSVELEYSKKAEAVFALADADYKMTQSVHRLLAMDALLYKLMEIHKK